MREDSTPSAFRDAVAVLAMLAVVITIIIGLTYLLAPTTEHGPRPATPFAHRFWDSRAMKMVASLVKDGEVIDTFTVEMPTRDHLAEAAKKAFAHFRDRHPHMTVETDDVRIEFRDDKATS
jgi:hypothetical protein